MSQEYDELINRIGDHVIDCTSFQALSRYYSHLTEQVVIKCNCGATWGINQGFNNITLKNFLDDIAKGELSMSNPTFKSYVEKQRSTVPLRYYHLTPKPKPEPLVIPERVCKSEINNWEIEI